MKLLIGKKVKIVFKIDNSLLTYTADITHQDKNHISFVDRNGISYTHKIANIEEVVEQ